MAHGLCVIPVTTLLFGILFNMSVLLLKIDFSILRAGPLHLRRNGVGKKVSVVQWRPAVSRRQSGHMVPRVVTVIATAISHVGLSEQYRSRSGLARPKTEGQLPQRVQCVAVCYRKRN